MPIPKEFVPVGYSAARGEIRNGDLLLWQPTGLLGRFIARKTGGPFSHIGSASWAGSVLESHEQLQWYGGRTANLSSLVRQYPNKISVYRMPGIHGYKFSQLQRRRSGERYGWWELAHASRVALMDDDGIRVPHRMPLSEVSRDDTPILWDRLYRVPCDVPAFCSQAVVSDLRSAGCKPYPELAAWEVSPNMVAEAAEYMFTLW